MATAPPLLAWLRLLITHHHYHHHQDQDNNDCVGQAISIVKGIEPESTIDNHDDTGISSKQCSS